MSTPLQTGQLIVNDGSSNGGPILVIPGGVRAKRLANLGPVRFFYGDRSVTADTGDVVRPGSSVEIPEGADDIYAIAPPGARSLAAWRAI